MSEFKRFTAPRKLDILKIWRISQGRVIDHKDVTKRELEQWDVLEKIYGPKGLVIGPAQKHPLTPLLEAPPPPLLMRAEFKVEGPHWIKAIYDPLGFRVEIPKGHNIRLYWFYCVVKQLTRSTGICTHADLVHAMWPPGVGELPSGNILKVYTNLAKKNLRGEILESIWGRGFRLLPDTPLASQLQAA